MGVVKRRVLRGLWRRLVGVGIIGPGLLGAPALPFARLCVARDLGGCEHDYPRWGGHTPESIVTSTVLGASASIMGSELLHGPPPTGSDSSLCPTPMPKPSSAPAPAAGA